MSTPSPTARELTSLSQILHLTHHRNHNQHRLAKWYKSLSTLRRQVSKLLSEIQALDTARAFSSSPHPTTSSKKGKESKYVREARESVETRVRFWEERLMERWFVAFTNLTADNQYAPLGLMLLGCLAKVRMVVRPFGAQLGGTEDSIEEIKTADALALGNGNGNGNGNDLGEVIQRGDISSLRGNERIEDEEKSIPEEAEERQPKSTKRKKSRTMTEETMKPKKSRTASEETTNKKKKTDSTSAKPLKRKQKKGDAFDDLFSGLV